MQVTLPPVEILLQGSKPSEGNLFYYNIKIKKNISQIKNINLKSFEKISIMVIHFHPL
jgi:hypothetical protein